MLFKTKQSKQKSDINEEKMWVKRERATRHYKKKVDDSGEAVWGNV